MKKKYLFISLLLCSSACFSSCGNSKNQWNFNHGVVPSTNKDKSLSFYGMYPQSLVTDHDTLVYLNDGSYETEHGYAKYNANYYIKDIAHPQQGAKFYNDEDIIDGKYYWFSVERINWVVLKITQVDYIVTSFALLDVCRYNDNYEGVDEQGKYANNYEYSYSRSYLNDGFLNRAFMLNDEYLNVSTVDNSLSECHDKENNPYVSNNTEDRIFSLSYEDILNRYEILDINNENNRLAAKASDYAKAKGARIENNYGYYYLRTPSDNISNQVYAVSPNGELLEANVNEEGYCLRPSLRMNIPKENISKK